MVKKNGSLAEKHPELVKEWDYEKNIATPQEYTSHSNKNVYWICPKGHSYIATIHNRTGEGSGCPFCTNRRVLHGYNDLASRCPEIAGEWDYEKNSESPEDVLYTGKKKYYWKCPLGHSWKTMIYLRTQMHHGCPECNKFGTSFPEQAIYYYIQSVYKDAINGYTELEMELDIYIPSIKVAIEYDGYKFHYGKINRDNRKDDLCFEKGIKLIRIREQGLAQTKIAECIYRNHPDDFQTLDEVIKALFIALDNNLKIEIHVREDQLKIRSNYYQSLQESSLCIKFPQLAKEWCYEKNEQLTPNMFLAGSSVKVWWQCSKYSNHFWQDSIAHRTSLKRGCPICAGQKVLEGFNDLQTRAPLLVQEWSSNNKCKASEVAPSTSKKYLWKCGKCQEEYLASPANRLKGKGCPFCSGRNAISGKTDLKSLYPDIAREWDYEKNEDLLPDMFRPGFDRKVFWICPKGHHYLQKINKRVKGQGCKYCSHNAVLQGENDLATLRPDLAEQWMEEKNNMKASEVALQSNMKVWWKCPICNREWQAYVSNRTRAKKPFCRECNKKLK